MTDVVIVGGAATGWATAFHLKRIQPNLAVEVVEKDPTLARSSTLLSDGNMRLQFNLPENIEMSLYGLECIDNFGAIVGDDALAVDHRLQGNLFLVDKAGKEEALLGIERQNQLGCDTEWLDMEEVARRFPAARSERLVGGTFGSKDGPVDPGQVVDGYRRTALQRGVRSIIGTAQSVVVDGDVRGVVVDDKVVEADNVIVAAGAWSTDLLATVGISIPVDPVMRTVYVIAGQIEGHSHLPSIFLPSGAYMLPEPGNTFLMAWSTDADPIGFDFTPAPRSRFYEVIWPEIVSHLPVFDQLEVMQSWAGLYAQNTLDANAILGEWPGIDGLYVAAGFSGHGFQHCHAMGRHLAELITGTAPSIDLSRFGPERVISGEPYAEHAGRII